MAAAAPSQRWAFASVRYDPHPMRSPAVLPVVASLLLGFAVPARPAPAPAAPPLASIDADVERARKEFEIPGVALAVVKDGRVVLARGYGVKRQGAVTPVDGDTLFAIASNTKAFTAAALGLLVEDGKLAWDDPVTRHLPSFRMYDPYVSQEMTIRDLLTHRSGLGLGEGDLLYFPPSTFTRREIVDKVRFLKPATSFRSGYAYDNILYIVAGEVVAAVSGKSWETFVRERLLTPLGLRNTVTHPSAVPAGANAATPHAHVDGTLRTVAPDDADNIAAAGGILSSANDMARWVTALLQAGTSTTAPGGLKPRLVQELWTAHTIMPITEPAAPLAALKPRFLAYGLGFNLRDYRGRKLVTHTGGLSGMVSRVALVPEENLGVVVLTNQVSGGGRDAIAYRVLDAFLGAPTTDWVPAFKEAARLGEEHARAVEGAHKAARAAASRPSLPLAAYVGRYRDAWYGEATIQAEGAQLVLRFSRSPALTGNLEHWHYDTFVARWRDRTVPDAFVTFALRPDGSIDQFKMEAFSPSADFSFDYQDLLFRPVREK
jgi:CubicO group peptidase (beta-lactamase class C family)